MTAVFLETTAAVERIFGLPETKQFIKSVCEKKTLLSSTYVWGEFKRTFLNDHIICHTVFINSLERGEDLATALKRLPKYSNLRYQPRKMERAFDVVARLHEKPFDSLKQAIERLENDILYVLQSYFLHGLHEPLIKGADCQMTGLPESFTEPEGSNNFRFKLVSKCTKSQNPECDIISFWKHHENDLEAISKMDIPSDIPKPIISELEDFRSEAQVILDKMDKHPSEVFGIRCYAKIADLIICLECPPDAPIITSNMKHYRLLCETLNRPDPIWS